MSNWRCIIYSLFCISTAGLYMTAKSQASKELSWRCRRGHWDSRPIIKLWEKSSSRSPSTLKNPITQKPWLWTPLPHPEMTQLPVLPPVRQWFCIRSPHFFPFFFYLHISQGVFKAALRSHISEQCRLKGSTGNMTARRNSECHNWHIPHPFGLSSPFFWTPDWFWQPILGISYEREFCD